MQISANGIPLRTIINADLAELDRRYDQVVVGVFVRKEEPSPNVSGTR